LGLFFVVQTGFAVVLPTSVVFLRDCFFADIFGEIEQLHFSCVEELNEFPVACAYRAPEIPLRKCGFSSGISPLEKLRPAKSNPYKSASMNLAPLRFCNSGPNNLVFSWT